MVSSDHHHHHHHRPMEESQTSQLVHSMKLSSVGPGSVTDSDLIHEPENMDLAMKLHYLRVVYYFKKEAFDGLTTLVIKEPMFTWLNTFPVVCGRFRRVESSGRPYIKCNDCGVRLVEAKCDKDLKEWLEIKDAGLERKLVPIQVLGPELGFSPLVFIQLTKFNCGGMAVGLSWAHVLGDAFSAAEVMNMLGQVVAGQDLGQPINVAQTHTKPANSNENPKAAHDPISTKRVEPVGDHWVINPTNSNMESFSFHITPSQLSHLQSKFKSKSKSAFEAISSVLWQCIARIRNEQSEPKAVTICKGSGKTKTNRIISNSQVINIVKADIPIASADVNDLATLIEKEAIDEREKIEEAMEKENGLADFFIYGANLTFVNLEEATFYEFDYRGQKPVNVSCWIDGVGEEGVVLVHRGSDDGRDVMVILPENEIVKLGSELNKEGLIA